MNKHELPKEKLVLRVRYTLPTEIVKAEEVSPREVIAHAFEGDLLLIQSRDPSGDTPVGLYAWRVGETTFVDLLVNATADLEGSLEELDGIVITYPFDPQLVY